MLALLEREVTNRGGSYAFCDTDSMAIVASKLGGLVPCPGGPHPKPDGTEAVRALSWAEVSAVVDRFAALNPYDRDVVPGSVLEVEDINFQVCGIAGHKAGCVCTQARRHLWCYAISAKRYALFLYDDTSMPVIADDGYSEHGLRHLLNPNDPESESRE